MMAPEMPSDPVSPLQEELGSRAFAFYPPIRNVGYNEWRYVRATWSEVLVGNEKEGIEVWVPRRLFGAISSVDEPIPIVGLTKELEYRSGSVVPFRNKLLEMPRASAEAAAVPAVGSPGVSGARRKGNANEGNVAKLIGLSLVLALVAIFLIVIVYRGGTPLQQRVIVSTADQEYLSLSAGDDYFSVVKRLGKPSDDRWRAQSKEVAFRVLEYPKRAYSVILFGPDQASATYIGTMDSNWRPVHSVPVGRSVDSAAMLRNLPRF